MDEQDKIMHMLTAISNGLYRYDLVDCVMRTNDMNGSLSNVISVGIKGSQYLVTVDFELVDTHEL